MIKIPGSVLVVPAVGLLAVSFFVLFARERVQDKRLKLFGMAIAIALWAVSLLVFCMSVYSMVRVFMFQRQSSADLFSCPKTGYHGAIDPHHDFMSDPHHSFLADPHRGSMTYHQYDEQGNVILDNSTSPDAP